MIFEMILIIVSSGKLVYVDLETQSTWMDNQQKSYNITYEITGMKANYILIDIKLSEINPDFLLVSDRYSAVHDYNEQFIQGETIDMISSLENRLTRQLIIPVSTPTLYVSTLDIKRQSKYSITITTSDIYPCVSSCSGKGYCIENFSTSKKFICECEEGYIGYDCSQEAKSIRGYEQEIELKQNPQFFYLDLRENEGNEVIIKISTDYEDDISVYILKTQALITPNQEQIYGSNKYSRVSLNKNNPTYVKVFLFYSSTTFDKLIFTAVLPKNNSQTKSSSLYFVTTKFQAPIKSSVQILTILIPIIVVLTILIYIFRFVKGRRIYMQIDVEQVNRRKLQYSIVQNTQMQRNQAQPSAT